MAPKGKGPVEQARHVLNAVLLADSFTQVCAPCRMRICIGP
jgi:hypothetical protein